MRHQLIIGSLMLLLAALPIAGCGDGNDNNDNGNGGGGRCGNGVVDDSSESCDGSDFDGATCQSLGFSGGTLKCSSKCQRDTTSCSGSGSRTPTPVVTATPGTGPTETTVTATATPDAGDTPTVTPTPNGPTCTGSESIVVKLSLDAEYTAARVDLGYPASANIPGSGTDTSVGDRIVFEGDGLKVRNDVDSDGDLVDDKVTAGFVGTDVQASGLFVTITFDCVAGRSAPSASDFTCDVVSASFQGTSITPGCTVVVQ